MHLPVKGNAPFDLYNIAPLPVNCKMFFQYDRIINIKRGCFPHRLSVFTGSGTEKNRSSFRSFCFFCKNKSGAFKSRTKSPLIKIPDTGISIGMSIGNGKSPDKTVIRCRETCIADCRCPKFGIADKMDITGTAVDKGNGRSFHRPAVPHVKIVAGIGIGTMHPVYCGRNFDAGRFEKSPVFIPDPVQFAFSPFITVSA